MLEILPLALLRVVVLLMNHSFSSLWRLTADSFQVYPKCFVVGNAVAHKFGSASEVCIARDNACFYEYIDGGTEKVAVDAEMEECE